MTEPIVVATDGSSPATAAVEWAADDAARKGLPLRVVHALDRLPYDIPCYPIPGAQDHMTRSGHQILRQAEKIARERQPGIEVSVEMIEGPPARVLRKQATRASELVVGSRGLGGFTGMLLGSVSMHVAGHVAAPVVVVRPGPMVEHAEIAVGFDGSAESEAALTYAFEEARLRGCGLRAVYAWQLPVQVYTPGIVYDIDEVRQAQQDYALGKLAAWQLKYPEVKVAVDIVCAHPVTALVEASQKADLLVVGSRGHGAIGAVVLGSVSRAVLQHAHCHVVVWSRTTSRADEVGEL
ncbi:universal stress protein [Planotetraspora phitsanulokensis]|uniref:Universal stress protein n=1 Tax=Planotetraspora phitsanulokensis TaxID=575192 RepID=A0A8J3UDC0_9ACTN|nr:universal stress protein [Planotetraspora phitsanulokensis]GII42752.1 universal stress protein [Planotetraspora phitsanulokensis]